MLADYSGAQMRPLRAWLRDQQEKGHSASTAFTHYWHSTTSVGYSSSVSENAHAQFSIDNADAHYISVS